MPLNNLLKKNQNWNWTPECQQSFQKLKDSLISKPILAIFNPNYPCHLYVDASKTAISCILKQKPNGNQHPIAFHSRRLRNYEINYTITELECLAIISLDKFYCYLHGSHFTVHTDRNALVWLKNFKNPMGRLFRWSLKASMYDFDIKYKKGSINVEADMLTRNPIAYIINTPPEPLLDINEISHFQNIENTSAPKCFKRDGVFVVKRQGLTKIIVPKALRVKLMETTHKKFGHPGVATMLKLISPQYYWINIISDIRNYVKHCETCQINKKSQQRKYGLMQSLPLCEKPFELLSIYSQVFSKQSPENYVVANGIASPTNQRQANDAITFTTKIRPAFDASARTTSQSSPNDLLYKGPNLIEQIPDILDRFRMYPFGLSADIEKAFLHLGITPKLKDFLRFFYPDEGEEIVYLHCRVVLGVLSSLILLAAVLAHLMVNVPSDDTELGSKLKLSFYIDNCVTEGVKVAIVRAKARVAPFKQVPNPRLELMACCIGARLAHSVQESLNITEMATVFWSDSLVALYWQREKGADLISRGCSPSHLVESHWWEGPLWLVESPDTWPITKLTDYDTSEISLERKKVRLCNLNLSEEMLPWYARTFSKFHSILRLVAWVLRFINNVRSRISDRKKGQLSLDELESAEIQLIRSVQARSFTDEKLISNLSVFRDDNNIIRLKTRITEHIDAPNFLSPILLPNNCIFTQRLVEHFHLKNHHAGTHLLLSIIRKKYWITGGRRTVRKIWKACVKCRRFKSNSPMTDPVSLPSHRVKDAAVFEMVGVDLAGPLYLKRGDKVCIVLYTYVIYRALHLSNEFPLFRLMLSYWLFVVLWPDEEDFE
ncbi:hypothetical protein TNCV_1686431 [Trichonephila clavipes]|nr:hypothetical protein TNCV_1686431 [Trichonephila clavipes]